MKDLFLAMLILCVIPIHGMGQECFVRIYDDKVWLNSLGRRAS